MIICCRSPRVFAHFINRHRYFLLCALTRWPKLQNSWRISLKIANQPHHSTARPRVRRGETAEFSFCAANFFGELWPIHHAKLIYCWVFLANKIFEGSRVGRKNEQSINLTTLSTRLEAKRPPVTFISHTLRSRELCQKCSHSIDLFNCRSNTEMFSLWCWAAVALHAITWSCYSAIFNFINAMEISTMSEHNRRLNIMQNTTTAAFLT